MRPPVTPGTCWAKRLPRNGGEPTSWHPLHAHAADVAACAGAVLDVPIIARRLAQLGGRDSLPVEWRSRIVVLAFLHDFGKANRCFQMRCAGHLREALALCRMPDLAKRSGLTALNNWGASPETVMTAMLLHHGRGLGEPGVNAYEGWQPAGAVDPVASVHADANPDRGRGSAGACRCA
jgi:CRISPR-associated endonuclease/helicase Cas3